MKRKVSLFNSYFMYPFIQNILAITALIIAVGFLITKFLLKKKQSKKSCGGDGDCGCH